MRSDRIYSLAECSELARVVPRRPPFAVVGTMGVLVCAIAIAVTWSVVTDAELVVRAPARVRAKNAPQLSFAASSGEHTFVAISGRVGEVRAAVGQRVVRGDVVAVLAVGQLDNDRMLLESAARASRDARDAAVRMQALAGAQFEAAQATRAAELAQVLREETRQRRGTSASVRLAEAAYDAALAQLGRVRALAADGAASQTDLDGAVARALEAGLQVEAARVGGAGGRSLLIRKQIVLAERDFAIRTEELSQVIATHAAEVFGAERRVANLNLDRENATIRAATTGTITSVGIGAGDVVQIGQAVFAIAPEDGVRIDAAVAVSDVGLLRIGMRVRIRFDAFDWQRYGSLGGTITQIAADAETAAGGGQPHYVVRIDPDREDLGRGELRGRLKLGMTASIDVVTGSECVLSLLVGRLRQAVAL